jgi:hypothetical protein
MADSNQNKVEKKSERVWMRCKKQGCDSNYHEKELVQRTITGETVYYKCVKCSNRVVLSLGGSFNL